VRSTSGNEGPEGKQSYISAHSLGWAADEGEWLTTRTGRFTVGKETLSIALEAGYASEPV